MSFFYAQINEDSICFAVTETYGQIDRDDMITLESYDSELLGQKWDATSSQWHQVEPGLLPEPIANPLASLTPEQKAALLALLQL
jgi:hypothetical protein